MSRSGYSNDCDYQWQYALWRGTLMSSIRGKRGQAFLAELVAALESMPQKRLIAASLVQDGEVCALGALAMKRGMSVTHINPEEYEQVADEFKVSCPIAQEVMSQNDDMGPSMETPEQRWDRMLAWAKSNLKQTAA